MIFRFTRQDSGPIWDWSICGDGGWTAIDPSTAPVTVYTTCNAARYKAGGGNYNIQKSDKKGGDPGEKNWNLVIHGLEDEIEPALFIPPLIMDPSDNQQQYLYFGTNHV
jgi:hypothetical protein